MSNPLRKFTFDVAWAFSGNATMAIIGFVLNLIVGNLLGAEGLGLYGIVITTYLLGSMVGAVGMPSSLIKHAAEYQSTASKLNRMVSTALITSTLLSLLTSLGIFALANPIGHLLDMPALPGLLHTLSIGLPLFMVNKTFLALLNGLRQMRLVSLIESSRYILIMVFTIIIINLGYGIPGTVYALIAPEFLLFPILNIFTRKFYRLSLQDFWATNRVLTSFGLQTFLSIIIDNVGTRLNLFLIAYFLTESDVGIFTAANMFYIGFITLPAAVQRITNPTIATYSGNRKFAAITNVVNQVMKYVMILLGSVSILFIILVSQVINTAYPNNPQFINAIPPLIILMFSLSSYGALASVGSTPASMSQPHWNIIYAIFSLSVALILNLLLLPRWGISGSALATSLTNILSTLFFLYILQKKLRLNIQITVLLKLFLINTSFNLLALLGIYLGLSPTLLIPLIITSYIGSLLLTNIVGQQDIILLQKILKPTQ